MPFWTLMDYLPLFFRWCRVFLINFLCLCFRIFFRLFLTTLPIQFPSWEISEAMNLKVFYITDLTVIGKKNNLSNNLLTRFFILLQNDKNSLMKQGGIKNGHDQETGCQNRPEKTLPNREQICLRWLRAGGPGGRWLRLPDNRSGLLRNAHEEKTGRL